MENICVECRKSEDCKRRPRTDQWTVAGCSWFKADTVITNADRIRSMTDDELTEWAKLMICKYRSCGNCPMSDWCEPGKGIAEWLKAPVEETDNG